MFKRYSSRQCLICLKDLDQEVSVFHLIYHPKICQCCLNSFSIIDHHFCFCNYSARILYSYNDFFRKLLFQYKGQYDYALKEAFLESFYREFEKKYRDYIIVVAPSSMNKERGFSPNEEICKTFHSSVFTGLYKEKDYKQTSQTNRCLVESIIKIKDGNKLKNRKVLLFDDVITSGYTMKTCLKLVEAFYPKSIEILVLASKQFSTYSSFSFDSLSNNE